VAPIVIAKADTDRPSKATRDACVVRLLLGSGLSQIRPLQS